MSYFQCLQSPKNMLSKKKKKHVIGYDFKKNLVPFRKKKNNNKTTTLILKRLLFWFSFFSQVKSTQKSNKI